MKPSPQSKLLTYPSLPSPQFSFVKKWTILRTSLAVQWLRLHTPSSGGPGLIPGQGTRSHMLQLKIPHAASKTWCSQIKKWRKRGLCNAFPFPRELLICFPSVYVTLYFLEFYGNGIIHSVLYHFLFIFDLLIFIISRAPRLLRGTYEEYFNILWLNLWVHHLWTIWQPFRIFKSAIPLKFLSSECYIIL